eukprot:2854823-Alexandrium_andersonii.AAC.1
MLFPRPPMRKGDPAPSCRGRHERHRGGQVQPVNASMKLLPAVVTAGERSLRGATLVLRNS